MSDHAIMLFTLAMVCGIRADIETGRFWSLAWATMSLAFVIAASVVIWS